MKRNMMLPLLLAVCLLFSAFPEQAGAEASTGRGEFSLIIEVKGDPKQHKLYIERHYPAVEVVAVYEKLFTGLAIRGKEQYLKQLGSLDFIQAIHPVQTYRALSEFGSHVRFQGLRRFSNAASSSFVFPNQLNDTKYTGKGVKVGVIDTGIDYSHPDLKKNYKGGYDAVDLDDDPMETKPEEGIPTLHGSHVAGIIAANGNLKGVAPDAEVYAYRALGPGGSGTSVQVIAAMEEAAKDGVDIMNLSLGNTVNGPDYPTSIAVNRAEALGIAVVVANGNDGPGLWTVGSPATAAGGLGVGAASHPQTVPYLEETLHHFKIPLTLMKGSTAWDLERGAYIADGDRPESDLKGKLALMEREKERPFSEKAAEAEARGAIGVLICNNEKGALQGALDETREPVSIPVAAISQSAGKWLKEQLKEKEQLYLNAKQARQEAGIANFSSRGPVTASWQIKPDVLAPGTNIVSTVPGGYEALQGTSMAAPHAAGAAALVKEAHPDWTPAQIFGALKTTASRVITKGKPAEPILQGMGHIRPQAAIHTSAIIEKPQLAFGKLEKQLETKTETLVIENMTGQSQRYRFRIPKAKRGMRWQLPASFVLKPHEKKEIKVQLGLYAGQLEQGIHQGWIELERDGEETYRLPYMFISQSADDPKAMGLEFSLKPFSSDTYRYQLYLGDHIEHAEVYLYQPDTLLYDRTLIEIDAPKPGMNEGEIKKKAVPPTGQYIALIAVRLENGKYETYESMIYIQ